MGNTLIDDAMLRSVWPQAHTLLNSSLVASGIEHAGIDARLSCVRAALLAGRRVSMSAVGGSITAGSSYAAGSGSAADFLYHRKVAFALNKRFPVAGGHAHHNGGVPGTGPTYMEHCVHDHLAADVELVLAVEPPHGDGARVRAGEQPPPARREDGAREARGQREARAADGAAGDA